MKGLMRCSWFLFWFWSWGSCCISSRNTNGKANDEPVRPNQLTPEDLDKFPIINDPRVLKMLNQTTLTPPVIQQQQPKDPYDWRTYVPGTSAAPGAAATPGYGPASSPGYSSGSPPAAPPSYGSGSAYGGLTPIPTATTFRATTTRAATTTAAGGTFFSPPTVSPRETTEGTTPEFPFKGRVIKKRPITVQVGTKLPVPVTSTTTEKVTTTATTPSLIRTIARDDRKTYPKDCADIQIYGFGTKSGIYRIYRPSCLNPTRCEIKVVCDLQTDGGGWTVMQQRLDDDLTFYRSWKAYKDGFGDRKNFWIGNEYLYEITNMGNASYALLIQLSDFHKKGIFALYNNFRVSPEIENYKLELGSMFGSSAAFCNPKRKTWEMSAAEVDNLSASRGSLFGTFDQDHDMIEAVSCGQRWESGWWHHPVCDMSGDLNVPYQARNQTGREHLQGIQWVTDSGIVRIKTSQMKIRPGDFPLRMKAEKNQNFDSY